MSDVDQYKIAWQEKRIEELKAAIRKHKEGVYECLDSDYIKLNDNNWELWEVLNDE